uniref:Uncharacterized protein n=1 Tax=Anguilla anguilla TaxID=7936 RepID=A0A0E9T5L1_ANGAN
MHLHCAPAPPLPTTGGGVQR